MTNILFEVIDWNNVIKTRHNGETGFAVWQTLNFDGSDCVWLSIPQIILPIIGVKWGT